MLIFVDAGLFLSSTRYAKPPPDPRTYAYYSFGGGLRYTQEFLESFAVYLQGNAGLATSTEDVLVIYGYRDSNELSLYFGGQLGFEWFQGTPTTHLPPMRVSETTRGSTVNAAASHRWR